MNRDEQRVERLLEECAGSMAFEGEQRVWNALRRRAERPSVSGRRIVAIALVAVLLLGCVAFADEIGRVIKRLTAGNISGTQMSEMVAEDGTRLSGAVHYTGVSDNPVIVGDLAKSEWIEVKDFEEAQAMLDFELHQPEWLPEGCAFHHASLLRYETGAMSNSADLYYDRRADWINPIVISEEYLGPNGRMDVKTLTDVTQTTVNGHDAILTNFSDDDASPELFWVQDGIAYHVSADDLETSMRIAESIR